MGVTLKEIALKSGVSEATASLALNDKSGVNQDTRRRVLENARQMGYVPSVNAKALARKRSRLIGLLVPNIRNLFRSNVVQEIEFVLRKNGYRMIFATTDSDEEYERKMIEQFVSFRVECVVLYPSIKDGKAPRYLDLLKKNGIPLVFLNGRYENVDAPCVMTDLEDLCQKCVDHLFEQGYERPIYMGACRKIYSSRKKIEYFTKAMRSHGASFERDDYIELEHTNYQCAFAAVEKLLSSSKAFDAVITGDTYSGFGALNALREHGVSVPGEAAIIHFENFMKPDLCVMRMTCVELGVPRIARAVLNTIECLIHGEATADLWQPCKLVVRDSTGKKL